MKLAGAVNNEQPICEGTFEWTSDLAGTDTVNVSNIHLIEDWNQNYTVAVNLKNQSAGIQIQPKTISADMFADLLNVTYNGKEHKPELTVTETLLTAEDYQVSYAKNINAGIADIAVTGRRNFAGEATLHFTILPADFSYTVNTQTVFVDKGLDQLDVAKTASGVNREQVNGTLHWYLDENYSKEIDETYVFAGETGDKVTLYWAFLPSGEETNYSKEAVKGEVTLTLQGKTVPVIKAESHTKDYDGKQITINDLTADALALDGTKEIKGTWSFGKNTPILKDAGIYQVELIFEPDDTVNYVSASSVITVEIKKLHASVSFNLSTNRMTSKEEMPVAQLSFTGVLDGESLIPELALVLDGMPSTAVAGTYVIKWDNADEVCAAISTLDASKNYDLSIGTTEETLTITDTITLPSPAGSADVQYRLEMSTGINELPDSLAGKYENVEELYNVLYQTLIEKQPGAITDQMALYDLKLFVSVDDGAHWTEADENNFPKEGITVVLPYPEGTNKDDYTFMAAHMFTVDMNGYMTGEIETVNVENREDGICFTLHGLSPVCVSWISAQDEDTKPDSGVEPGQDPSDTEKNPDDATTEDGSVEKEPETGVNTDPMLWMMFFIFGAGMLTMYVKKQENK